ncbi:MAG TPA: hypothetical protein VE913_23910, partial [Longimicrobium sp.]|nr:hypothetical protein [Longimicrobium sp.]
AVSAVETRDEDAALLAATALDEAGESPNVRRACVDALSLLAGRPTYTELNEIGPARVRALLEEIIEGLRSRFRHRVR